MGLLESIISSTARIQILMRLFLNPDSRAYLRELANEFGCSTGQLSYELKQLSGSLLIEKEKSGRNILYRANEKHPLFPELRSMVMKALGMDQIVETVLNNLGDLELALLLGDYAEGKDTGIVDLVLVGKVDKKYLDVLVTSAEKHIKRHIRSLVLSRQGYMDMRPNLEKKPHLILWDKTKNRAKK